MEKAKETKILSLRLDIELHTNMEKRITELSYKKGRIIRLTDYIKDLIEKDLKNEER